MQQAYLLGLFLCIHQFGPGRMHVATLWRKKNKLILNTIKYLKKKSWGKKRSLHWVHNSNSGPFSSFSIDLVSHYCSSNMVSMHTESKRIERQYAIFDLAACVPKLWNMNPFVTFISQWLRYWSIFVSDENLYQRNLNKIEFVPVRLGAIWS